MSTLSLFFFVFFSGEQLSFQQRDNSLGHNWVKVSPILTWQRFWITGSSVELVLAKTYKDLSQAYTFNFGSTQVTLSKNGQQLASQGKKLKFLLIIFFLFNQLLGNKSCPSRVKYFRFIAVKDSRAVEGINHLFAASATFWAMRTVRLHQRGPLQAKKNYMQK